MEMLSNDPKSVAETALLYEAEGHKILVEAGTQATDPLSKATFEFLANQEIKHMEAIKAFASSLDGKGEFDTEALTETSVAQACTEIKGIFTKFKDEFDEAAACATRLDVYDIAMDMERRGHDLYADAAKASTDADARKLYQFLANEEVHHFEIIQDTHDFLQQPDAFMAVEERWMQF